MLSRRNFLSLLALSLIGAGLPATLAGCTTPPKNSAAGLDAQADTDPAKLVVFLFDTIIEIQAYCPQKIMNLVEERLVYFENTFSKTIAGSDIYAINHAEGAPTRVQPETADIIAQALQYSELSNGLFDISIGSVMELWDFKAGIVPTMSDLEEALRHVDYRAINLDGQTVTLSDPHAKLDLGGIAKGYIADDIVRLLKDAGCSSALINLGGNTYALGAKPDGSPWRVGLQDPNRPRGSVLAATPAIDRSVVTSGINERSFTKDGITYHHLLDPKTGMPSQNGTASSTIISDLSVDGDAFTTITFLLGATKGLALAEEQPGFQALFVDTEGMITSSPDLEVESL